MKKKGFTLIELLAVIVILAIIALIATPLVLKYIEYSKEKSAKLSAQTYADAVEKEYVSKLTHNEKMPNKEYTIKELDELGVKVKGDKPEGDSDTVTLQNGTVIKYTLTINGYIITYENGNTTVESEKDSDTANNGDFLDYTVKFIVDGKTYEIVSVAAGNQVSEPTTKPTKEGENLAWWLLDGKKQSFPFVPTANVEIDAYFSPIRYDLEDASTEKFFETKTYYYKKRYEDVSILGYWTTTVNDKEITYPVIVSRVSKGCQILHLVNSSGTGHYEDNISSITVNGETWYYLKNSCSVGDVITKSYRNTINLNDYVNDNVTNFEEVAETLVKIYLGIIPKTD